MDSTLEVYHVERTVLKKITFTINETTPHELSMTRLLEYLTQLATMLGNREDVHFQKVEEGSLENIIEVEEESEPLIAHRVQLLVAGEGTVEGKQAFKRLRDFLDQDNYTAELTNEEGGTITEFFPPKKDHSVYGPIFQEEAIDGFLINVGGKDATVPVLILVEGKKLSCNADIDTARAMGHLLQKPIRLHGRSTWFRNKFGKWDLEWFDISRFEELRDDTVLNAVARLRAIPDNDLKSLDDPLEAMRKIRHGE
jgi:hypothetical protein